MKKVVEIRNTGDAHWVGDGFPVETLFSYTADGAGISPFLLLDYARPHEFGPSKRPRGVGRHPHRGFETVTLVYQGEVEHGDSEGNQGKIGPGDVQWMTAASGVVHEEFHSAEFTERGGTFEVVQLWVNLPAGHKMAPPGYQEILGRDIPTVDLPEGAGRARVVAGELLGVRGPARTFTPVGVWDLRLGAGKPVALPVPDGHTALLVVLQGEVAVGDGTAGAGNVVFFDPAGEAVAFRTTTDTTALFLTGAPINEPIAGYGPFVMNTAEEIHQALDDYRSGLLGRAPSPGRSS